MILIYFLFIVVLSRSIDSIFLKLCSVFPSWSMYYFLAICLALVTMGIGITLTCNYKLIPIKWRLICFPFLLGSISLQGAHASKLSQHSCDEWNLFQNSLSKFEYFTNSAEQQNINYIFRTAPIIVNENEFFNVITDIFSSTNGILAGSLALLLTFIFLFAYGCLLSGNFNLVLAKRILMAYTTLHIVFYPYIKLINLLLYCIFQMCCTDLLQLGYLGALVILVLTVFSFGITFIAY